MFDQKIVDIITRAGEDKKKKPKPLNKIFKGAKGTHKMPDGTIMSGSKHSKSSKVVKAAPSPKRGRGKRSGY